VNKRFVYSSENGFVHESAKRLLDCAKAATAGTAYPIGDFNDLAKRLPVSSAVMSNWKKRGVSRDGAIAAERLFKCSVQWILEGQGSPDVGALRVEESAPPEYVSLRQVRLTDSEVQLIRMYRELSEADRAEVLDDVHRRAARTLGDKLLADRFGVTGYASDARVSETIKPAPVPGDRRKVNIPVEHDRRKQE
jgi:hypothetical protein